MSKAVDLAQENLRLREQIAQQSQQLSDQSQQLSDQSQQLSLKSQRISQLEEMLHTLTHRQYAASTEACAHQTSLFDEAESPESDVMDDDEPQASSPSVPRKRTKRASIPDWIERQEIIHDLSDSDKVCPHDGTPLQHIGDETHEQLDIVPAQIKALRHIRRKYACPCCESYLKTASKPLQPIEKSIASPGLLAHIILSKYADALPLYRQADIFKRLHIDIDRTSMANWMIRCGDLIQPLVNLLRDKLLESPVLHMDETVVQVLKEPGKSAQSNSYMWVMTNACQSSPIVLFHYAPSRGQAVPVEQLSGYHGALMVDGYEGYRAVCEDQALIRLGCWAHARRKFVEAQRAQPKKKRGRADQALSFIQKLYAVEKSLRDAPADKRYEARQLQSKPIIDKFRAWLEKSLPQVPPQSALGKALQYLDNQWGRLIAYLDDGQYPIDNNRAENAIRPFVVGRKNWLFSHSQSGARSSANLYSLVQTAKACGVDLYAYFKYILTRLPLLETVDDVECLLPWNFKGGVG